LGPHTRSGRPIVRSASLLMGRTHLSGTIVSLVGGDPGVPMSHTHLEGRWMVVGGGLRCHRYL
jgi:hypothetical protein